jgi:hypothetical protein
LLLLDGTEKADKLEKVLQIASECGVLLTSRRREDAIDHRYRYDILHLSIKDSVKLFEDWSGTTVTDDAVAREIYRLLDGVPLAIRLAGSYIEARKVDVNSYLDWLNEALMDALDRGETEHKNVRLLLERSVNNISEISRKFLS